MAAGRQHGRRQRRRLPACRPPTVALARARAAFPLLATRPCPLPLPLPCNCAQSVLLRAATMCPWRMLSSWWPTSTRSAARGACCSRPAATATWPTSHGCRRSRRRSPWTSSRATVARRRVGGRPQAALCLRSNASRPRRRRRRLLRASCRGGSPVCGGGHKRAHVPHRQRDQDAGGVWGSRHAGQVGAWRRALLLRCWVVGHVAPPPLLPAPFSPGSSRSIGGT